MNAVLKRLDAVVGAALVLLLVAAWVYGEAASGAWNLGALGAAAVAVLLAGTLLLIG